MQSAVRNAWCAFNRPIEGWINWMYLDVRGLVTTGMGNEADPLPIALTLPWQDEGAAAAAQNAIAAEWQAVKGNFALANDLPSVAQGMTRLRLSDSALETIILQKLDANEAIIKAYAAFRNFESWPADAQLGVLSMAWALGAGFGQNFPHFSQAIAAGDFQTAAADCAIITTGNIGVVRRNAANRQAFMYAAAATDPQTLYSVIPPF